MADCLDIFPTLQDSSIDFVLTDLPYGTTKCKWDIVIPFEEMWEQLSRIVKPTGAVCLFGTEPFASHLRLSNIHQYRYDWVWDKARAANFLFMNRQPGKVHEHVCTFYKKQPTYNPQKRVNPHGPRAQYTANPAQVSENVKSLMGTKLEGWEPSTGYERDKLLPNSIIRFTKDTYRTHPTQKPVALLEYLIRTYTVEGDTVLDFCMGTGSCGVASRNTRRSFIGIEKDQQYFSIAENSLSAG